MLRLGYPELVLGDCYKAPLLLEAVERADNAYDDVEAAVQGAFATLEGLRIRQESSNTSRGPDQALADWVRLYVGMQLWVEQIKQCPVPIEN